MIREAIRTIVSGNSLTQKTAAQVMSEMMSGDASPSQIAAFVTAIRMKGETVEEISGMAQVMRARSLRIEVAGELVDTCGTGGDGSESFNISTASAFIVAGAGAIVAKHGNRSASGSCGSADVLEALGVKIDLPPEKVKRCLEEVGIGFMFAPNFHPAMKNAAGPRKEIGIRTVFNILGPLTNPANAQCQVVGVADPSIGEKLAQVLKILGSKRAMVVHGQDGLDEITLSDLTTVWELRDGAVESWVINPAELTVNSASLDVIRGGSIERNVAMVSGVLQGKKGPCLDIATLNASAALMVAEKAANIQEGLVLAKESVATGSALERLESLVRLSQKLGE